MYQSANVPIYRLFCLILLLASGCGLFPPPSTPTPTPTPTLPPTHTPTLLPPTPWPTPTPEPPDTGWQLLQPGAELRQVHVEIGDVAERLTIVRLDPATVHFRVHYTPVAPSPVSGWAERLQPLLVVNGSYFTPEDKVTGLLVSDGQLWGTSYGDFAGMFAVNPSPSFLPTRGEENVSVRWLRDQPYDPNEPLKEALQSFPVLVKPGGIMGFPADADDGRPARRTVVAQDFQGRILFIVAPRGHLSLHELACFLAESDLDLDIALNLDGGYSTGLWLKTDTQSVEIDSLVPVPSVISVRD